MSDDFTPDGEDFEPEGGAGGSLPDNARAKPLARPPKPAPEESPTDKAMRQRYEALSHKVDMSRGGALSAMAPDDVEFYKNYRNKEGLGRFVAAVRGVPLIGSHIDELSALLQTGDASGQKYKEKRDDARKAVSDAEAEHPLMPLAGSMAFAPFAPESAAGRVALSTAMGASEGVGEAPTMKEAPAAGAVGGGVGLGVGLLGEFLRSGGKYMGSKREGVEQKVRDDARKSADKAFASARGTVGQREADAAQALRVLEERANSAAGDPATRAAARDALDSEEAQRLRDQIARGYLRRWTGLGSSINSARDEMAEAALGQTDDAVSAAARARLDDPSALIRRARELGPKVVLPMVGGAMAGPVGAGAGALGSAALGRSSTTLRNAIADPYVSSRLYGAGQAVLGGAGTATQASAPIMSKAALQSDSLAPYLELLREKEDKSE